MNTRLTILFTVCMAASQILYAQQRYVYSNKVEKKIPVFQFKEDSIQYADVEQALALRNYQSFTKFDSLWHLRTTLLKERPILRYKYEFTPTEKYFVADSLSFAKDFNSIQNLSINNTSTVPKHITKCKNLKTIELINTSIQKLPRRLNKLKKLEKIEIYNNEPTQALKLRRNKRIKILVFRKCPQRSLPGSYKKYTALEVLDLSDNELTAFPNGASRNKRLKELLLQSNSLTLADPIRRHPSVTVLSLRRNTIEKVSASISQFPNLTVLEFNNNPITSVDSSIASLKNLEEISFYNNKLTSIPKSIYELQSLKKIDLFFNQIQQLDSTLCHWQNLEVLDLSFNKIVFLPDNIDELSALRELHLADNRIDRIPVNTGNIRGLKVLKVNHNYIKTVPETILNLIDLEELDIANNYIQAIPSELFAFKKFKILSIENNCWSEETKKFLTPKIEELRRKGVFVHFMGELDQDFIATSRCNK
jgi:Leucine-rich repeat (LRR) protein